MNKWLGWRQNTQNVPKIHPNVLTIHKFSMWTYYSCIFYPLSSDMHVLCSADLELLLGVFILIFVTGKGHNCSVFLLRTDSYSYYTGNNKYTWSWLYHGCCYVVIHNVLMKFTMLQYVLLWIFSFVHFEWIHYYWFHVVYSMAVLNNTKRQTME